MSCKLYIHCQLYVRRFIVYPLRHVSPIIYELVSQPTSSIVYSCIEIATAVFE